MKELTIGRVAKSVGLNPRTIRYYERIGLISPPRGRPGGRASAWGYRLFSEAEARKLTFIKKARALNFSLREIKVLSTLLGNGKRPSPALVRLLESKLNEIRGRSKLLHDLQGDLTTLLQRARQNDQGEGLSLPTIQQCCEPLCGPEICR